MTAHDTAIGCPTCQGENLIYRGVARPETDGNGQPKDETRLWWHDHFPVMIAGRSTLPVETIATVLHERNPEESKIALAMLAPKVGAVTGDDEPIRTETGTLQDEFVEFTADEWAKIQAVLIGAGRVLSESTRYQTVLYLVDGEAMDALEAAYHVLPDQYKTPIIATGGLDSLETAEVVPDATGADMAPPERLE